MIYKFKLVGFVKKGFVQLQFYQYTTNTPVLSSFGNFSRLEFAEVHTEEVGCERANLGALAHVSNLAKHIVCICDQVGLAILVDLSALSEQLH